MIKALLLDDEAHCLESLSLDIEKYCPEIEICSAVNSAKAGLKQIKQIKPDLVFLDIEMPWMNGFELLDYLKPIDFEVIFVTAYDSYAVKAFKVNAIDYLMKPVDKDDLIKAVKKVKAKLAQNESSQPNIHTLLDQYFDNRNQKKIIFAEKDRQNLVSTDDIIYAKAESNYSKIVLQNEPSLTLSITLKTIEKKLQGHRFLRVHHSYLVNMNKVSQYIKTDGGYLVLSDDSQIPISRSRKEDLKSLLKEDYL